MPNLQYNAAINATQYNQLFNGLAQQFQQHTIDNDVYMSRLRQAQQLHVQSVADAYLRSLGQTIVREMLQLDPNVDPKTPLIPKETKEEPKEVLSEVPLPRTRSIIDF